MENAPSPSPSCPTCGPWWLLPMLLALVLAAIIWSRVRGLHEATPEAHEDRPAPAADSSAREKVSLAIDFGDGQRKNLDPIAWHDGMTVADAIHNAPGLNIVQQRSGQFALLTSINGVANQGAAGQNWTYFVNGRFADQSFAVYKLQPGDQVLWTFGSNK